MRQRLANAFLEPKDPLDIENPEDGMRSTGFESSDTKVNNIVPLENIFGPDGFESKILSEDDGLSTGDNHRMEFGLFDDDFEDYHEPMTSSNGEDEQSTATARADETTYVSLEENERYVIFIHPRKVIT